MIFVTLGSQKFQFNRLLIEIDRLIEEGKIVDDVFAQIGYSDYKPMNYKYKDFLDRDEFSDIMSKCDKVITHGGTGAIIGAIKLGKKVISVPRLSIYGEHVDDHQIQIIEEFAKQKLIIHAIDINNLSHELSKIEECTLNEYISNTKKIIDNIDDFIVNL